MATRDAPGRSRKVKTSDAREKLRGLFKKCVDLADKLEPHSIRKFFKSLTGRDTEDDLNGLIRSLYKGFEGDFHDDVNGKKSSDISGIHLGDTKLPESTFYKLVEELEQVHQGLKEALSAAKGKSETGVNFVELTKISENVIFGATGWSQ